MVKDRKPTADETALFQRTLRDVVRRRPTKKPEAMPDISEGGALLQAQKKPSQSPRKAHGSSAVGDSSPKGSPRPHLVVDDRSGADGKTMERFRRGRMPIEAVLDLHGLRQHEAEQALQGFLSRCQARGFRCVMVVTGKGKRSLHEAGGDYMSGQYGVLRQALPDWLNRPGNRDRVLAVHTAQRQHGGSGAFYVLLKRLRTRHD